MEFYALDLIDRFISHPSKSVSKNVTSFLRSRIYREAKKRLGLNSLKYVYCKQSKLKELAFYIMGTKKNPVIMICSEAIKRFSKRHRLGSFHKKLFVYSIILHEMAHAYLDRRGLVRHSESQVDRFAMHSLEFNVRSAKKLLDKYLAERKHNA